MLGFEVEGKGRSREKTGIRIKEKGLSRKLISKKEFSAPLTCFFLSFMFFLQEQTQNCSLSLALHLSGCEVTLCIKKKCCGVKSSTDVFLFKFHDNIHF